MVGHMIDVLLIVVNWHHNTFCNATNCKVSINQENADATSSLAKWCGIVGQFNSFYVNNPFTNQEMQHTKPLRHRGSHKFSVTATVLRTQERAHSASLLSGPLTCKCPPAIRHQQRAVRGKKNPLNWNVNSNFWHARDIWESRAASQEKCKKEESEESTVNVKGGWWVRGREREMEGVIEGAEKNVKTVWWRRGRRGSNSSQKVSCQRRSRAGTSKGEEWVGAKGGERWRKDGRAPVLLWESLPILLLLFLLQWWTGWNTTRATSCNDLMNELLQTAPLPPPPKPPSHTPPFALSPSPITTSHTRKPAVSAFTLKHIYIQRSVWYSQTCKRCCDKTVGLICHHLYILNAFFDTESHSNQTVFAFAWFDSSCDSAAITLCTVLSKVINSGFSNQWLWLCLVWQINVGLWCCFYFIWHVPLCPLLYFSPQTLSKKIICLNITVSHLHI